MRGMRLNVVTIRRSVPRPWLAAGQIEETLSSSAPGRLVRRGESIAIAVGSLDVADEAAVVTQAGRVTRSQR